MNISTLAKILGVSISDLRSTADKNRIPGFGGRNTRIPYNSALEITKVLRPDRLQTFENDDTIYIPEIITVNDLAETIGRPAGLVVKTLVLNGVMATLNEKIDFDTASLISSELGVEIKPETRIYEKSSAKNTDQTQTQNTEEAGEKVMISRHPVVTVMGHVDHGKTTLLDTIRQTNVVSQEAGAITQHISSYQISFKDKQITFVDTPGHEAFTAMRARGSKIADFIILVVSAVEGPKPQTVEVIERAKLTKTPVIVAINKIDLPNADVEKAKADVSSFGLVPEEWGGDTPYIAISAKNNENIDILLDTLLLHSEVAELKGQVECNAQAVVVESHLDPKLGVVTVALVIRDTVKVGDFIQCNEIIGKIKRLEDSNGIYIDSASLSEPVLLLGLPEVVNVGEIIQIHKTQKESQIAADSAKLKLSQRKFVSNNSNTTGSDGVINVILKADVFGSLEALKESILKIPQEKVLIQIKQESVGPITSNDVEYAKTTESNILAFNAPISSDSLSLIKSLKINVVQSSIIYEILQWVEEEILKNTKHDIKITPLGKAEVLAVFKSEKSTVQVFGGEVKEGKIFANKPLRLWRNNEEIGRLEVSELQRNKEKTSEVNISQQFGISVTGKGKIQVGDIIESIDEIVIK
jgi:translation initiation factor IF-2